MKDGAIAFARHTRGEDNKKIQTKKTPPCMNTISYEQKCKLRISTVPENRDPFRDRPSLKHAARITKKIQTKKTPPCMNTISYEQKCKLRISTVPENRDPFRDRPSLKSTTDGGISSEKNETRTGDIFVRTKPPNAQPTTHTN